MKKEKENYVDGFLLVVHKDKLADYRKMAKKGAEVWRKYGAIDYKECVIDDASPEHVTLPFGKAMNVKPGELVIFAYITYKSKADRNKINAKVMKDPTMCDPKYKDMPMPFDMKRFSFGGFKVMVDGL